MGVTFWRILMADTIDWALRFANQPRYGLRYTGYDLGNKPVEPPGEPEETPDQN